MVLNTYYRRSGLVNVTRPNNENGDHVQKIKQVYQTLCGSLRHPDEILTSLFERRAVTQQEQDSIRSQTNPFQWTSHLLDVLCAKPASAYKRFLEALDATQQHHLHLLLDNIGYLIHYLTIFFVNLEHVRVGLVQGHKFSLSNLKRQGVLLFHSLKNNT